METFTRRIFATSAYTINEDPDTGRFVIYKRDSSEGGKGNFIGVRFFERDDGFYASFKGKGDSGANKSISLKYEAVV